MPRSFFSLPRLIAKLRGGSAERSEANWLEANAVGTTIHTIVYVFFVRLLLSHLPIGQQLVFLLPLAVFVLVFWLILFQVQAALIRFARAAGRLRDIPDSRAQGALIGTLTTAFAFQLVAAGSWMRVIGAVWLIAVSLNLLAALILALSDADRSAVL